MYRGFSPLPVLQKHSVFSRRFTRETDYSFLQTGKITIQTNENAILIPGSAESQFYDVQFRTSFVRL